MDDLADRITLIMTQKGLKASEIADATGITRPVMSRYLANRSGMSAENLIKLSQYLNVSPDWLLNGSDAPEAVKMSKSVSVDKNKIIAVQEELIKTLQKQGTSQSHYIQALFKKLEEALKEKTTPDEAIKKLFDLIDQSSSYSAFATGRAGFDEKDEDQQWIQTEIGRLDAEMNTIRSMFFSEEEIQDRQNANMERVQFLPPKSPKRGRPRKK